MPIVITLCIVERPEGTIKTHLNCPHTVGTRGEMWFAKDISEVIAAHLNLRAIDPVPPTIKITPLGNG